MGDNPPCNTLFIGNLSETVNEAEITSVFSNSVVSVCAGKMGDMR
jgi:RNA recognition motif-containing protein